MTEDTPRRPRVVVVVPALNEERTLRDVLVGVSAALEAVDLLGILVVADRCTDRTAAIAHESGAYYMELSEIESRGLGDAFGHGTRAAQRVWPEADYYVHIDADGQYATTDIPLLLAQAVATDGEALVCGNRLHCRPAQMPLARYVLNRVFSFLISVVLRSDVKDAQTGLRVIPRKWIDTPISCPHTYTQEQIIRILRSGGDVRFVSIDFVRRAYGVSRVAPNAFFYAKRTLPRLMWLLAGFEPKRWRRLPGSSPAVTPPVVFRVAVARNELLNVL